VEGNRWKGWNFSTDTGTRHWGGSTVKGVNSQQPIDVSDSGSFLILTFILDEDVAGGANLVWEGREIYASRSVVGIRSTFLVVALR
jgi:hypothetical protein